MGSYAPQLFVRYMFKWTTLCLVVCMPRKLVLYGNSLVLSSLGASLKKRPAMTVVVVDERRPDANDRLRSLQADVALVDLAATEAQVAFELCRLNPTLLVVGVDLRDDRAVLLIGGTAHVLSNEEFVRVLENGWTDNLHKS